MSKKEKENIKANIELLKKQIEETQQEHKKDMENLRKEKEIEINNVKKENEEKLKKIDESYNSSSYELEKQLKNVKESREKETLELKKQHKDKIEEDKLKIKNEKTLKKTTTKSNINDKENDILEEDIKKQKEEIQNLMRENQQILMEARENQNKINFYEMNFGQLFFSEELKQQIFAESEKYRIDYEKLFNEKMQQFAMYKNDPQLNKFLQLAQTNPMMHGYLIPQIYYEFAPPIM